MPGPGGRHQRGASGAGKSGLRRHHPQQADTVKSLLPGGTAVPGAPPASLPTPPGSVCVQAGPEDTEDDKAGTSGAQATSHALVLTRVPGTCRVLSSELSTGIVGQKEGLVCSLQDGTKNFIYIFSHDPKLSRLIPFIDRKSGLRHEATASRASAQGGSCPLAGEPRQVELLAWRKEGNSTC